MSAKKPADRRRGHNPTRDIGLVIVDTKRPVPALSKGWLKVTEALWAQMWGSEVAALWSPAEEHVVRRYADLADELERCWRAYRKERVVPGSMGQMRVNPLADKALAIETAMVRLEDRLGMSAKARLALGVQFGQAARSLEGVLNEVMSSDGDADEGAARPTIVSIPTSSRRSS